MKAYHGTTRENAIKIMTNKGIKDKCTWHCSDDDYLYIWCPDALILEGECEDLEEANERAINMAFESAQITAAISDNPQNELIVLGFEFPDKEIMADDSCENMELSRRIELENYSEFNISAYTCKHNSRLDAFIISGLLNNLYFPSYDIDDDLLEAAKRLKDIWIDSLYEFDYKLEKSLIND